jgi:hypothetical protein
MWHHRALSRRSSIRTSRVAFTCFALSSWCIFYHMMLLESNTSFRALYIISSSDPSQLPLQSEVVTIELRDLTNVKESDTAKSAATTAVAAASLSARALTSDQPNFTTTNDSVRLRFGQDGYRSTESNAINADGAQVANFADRTINAANLDESSNVGWKKIRSTAITSTALSSKTSKNETLLASLYGRRSRGGPPAHLKFRLPVLVVSLFKSGTTSADRFFKCGQIRSSHLGHRDCAAQKHEVRKATCPYNVFTHADAVREFISLDGG